MIESLPAEVIETDHKLEAAEHKASENLVKHRWHWTLNEANAYRVSIRAYASAVGKHRSTIQKQANGYAEWISGGAVSATLGEAIERANIGVERETVIEAVAQARGVGFTQARQARPDEVRRVRQIARERAEEHGTTVEDEAPKVAAAIVRAEQAEARHIEQRKQQHTLRFVAVEGKLARMLRIGTEILEDSHTVPFDEEERELLADSIAKVRALLQLIERRFADVTDVDWDAELVKIMGE